ncbi:MAG: hypothetical protein II670_13105, partial [Alphaproteobacteria bacterium]|nr:hypothetical protein [Alphaproteobacteria bacterium]
EVPVDINKDDLKGVICAINTNPPPPIAAAIGQNKNGEWEIYGANPPGSLEINGDKAYWDHGNGLTVETTLEINGNNVEQTVNAYIVNGIRYEREEPYTNPKRFSHTDEFGLKHTLDEAGNHSVNINGRDVPVISENPLTVYDKELDMIITRLPDGTLIGVDKNGNRTFFDQFGNVLGEKTTVGKQVDENGICQSCNHCTDCQSCFSACDDCQGCNACQGCVGCQGCTSCDGTCYGCFSGCNGCDDCYGGCQTCESCQTCLSCKTCVSCDGDNASWHMSQGLSCTECHDSCQGCYSGCNGNCTGCNFCLSCNNCVGCDYCVGCNSCDKCVGCDKCEGCNECQDCNSCQGCEGCQECVGCQICNDHCNFFQSGKTDCSDGDIKP